MNRLQVSSFANHTNQKENSKGADQTTQSTHLILHSIKISRMHGSRKFCQRGQQKAGHLRPTSKTALKWCFAGWPMMTHIECWLGSCVIFSGSGLVLLRNSMIANFHPLPPTPSGSAHICVCVPFNICFPGHPSGVLYRY